MELTYFKERPDIPKTYRKGKVVEQIEKFIESGMNWAEVTYEEGEYISVGSCYSSFAKALERYRDEYPVRVFTHQGHIYLERTDISETP